MRMIKESIQEHFFLVSLLFIMGIYLPVNYFSFVNMDDIGLVQRLHDNYSNINFSSLFFRNTATKYYRPLLEIINHLDYSIWGVSITGYHFGNYLVHILNTCLVYSIALHLFEKEKHSNCFAIFAMLFFGLHPLTCESVAWISGRSDLVGTFFSLLAIRFCFFKPPYRFILTPFFIFLGLLCKENALAAIPVLVLLECFINYTNKRNVSENIKACFVWGIILSIPLIFYTFLRTNGWEHYTYKYIEAVPLVKSGANPQYKMDMLELAYVFPVIAFYLKKLMVPYPLNFAISQFDTFFYSIGFILFFLSNIIGYFKRKISFIFFSMALVMSFAPCLPVSLGGISWVPLAERYLYFSASIMAVGMAFFIRYLYRTKKLDARSSIAICAVFIFVFSVSTFSRVFVWKDSKSLWADTLQKNPDNSMVLFKYGQAFGGEKAQWAYRKALENSQDFKWKSMTLMKIASYERSVGNYDKAIETFEKALHIKNSFDNYCEAAGIISGMETEDIQKEADYLRKAIDYYKLAYTKKKTPVVLYKTGVLLKKINKNNEANASFMEIIRKFPDSMYAVHSKKQLDRTIISPVRNNKPK